MPEKILVVDDDTVVRDEVADMLEEAGYKIIVSTDGNDSLAKVRDESPDLIVMDVEMPGMGGREACRIIKGNKRFGFIPIILVTARDDIQTKVEGLEMGADDYLVKPLNKLELLARVKSMLRMKALQSELIEANERLQGMNERLQELSMTDPLTGVYNRLFFQKRIEYEFQRADRYQTPLALIMLDLDHFKNINDSYGHPFGDIVLKGFSEILFSSVRGVDIVARYGGEEFVVACPETNNKQAMVVAERIRSKIDKARFTSDGVEGSVTTSIGIAVCPHPKIGNTEELLKQADAALYRAKQDGRNCIRFALKDES